MNCVARIKVYRIKGVKTTADDADDKKIKIKNKSNKIYI